jgi:hypothetical protein
MDTRTPLRKNIKPPDSIFLSADRNKNVGVENFESPKTPTKYSKTKLVARTSNNLLNEFPINLQKDLTAPFFRIIPSNIFKDIPDVSSEIDGNWLEKSFKINEQIGEGNFSRVYLACVNHKYYYALKRSKDSSSSSSNMNFRREIVNLWKLKGCKNILQIYLGWEDSTGLNILTDVYSTSYAAFLFLGWFIGANNIKKILNIPRVL